MGGGKPKFLLVSCGKVEAVVGCRRREVGVG
jgi:hypothetical protein